MGQRLNVEIANGDTVLANCYYHLAGYTHIALAVTQRILNVYSRSSKTVDVAMAVELLEATGGGINSEERRNINKEPERFGHITFEDDIDRNHGLIAVTEAGMSKTRDWEQGRVTIDLASQTVSFDALLYCEPDEYPEYFKCDKNWKFESLDECPFDFLNIPFSKFPKVVAFVNDHEDFVRKDDMVICWIE